MGKRSDGLARLAEEQRRCREMMERATPPADCGDEIPAAPARGPMTTWAPREVRMTDAGNWREVRAGYAGRSGARRADAFDRMTADARRVQAKARSGFIPPFTVGQVEAGRAYAALVERVEASGVKLASIERVSGGGDGQGQREAAVLDDVRRLKRARGRIGNGLAKEARRKGGARGPRSIPVRSLVDMVCLHDRSLSEVLKRHGWAEKGQHREELRVALRAALDRLHGYI